MQSQRSHRISIGWTNCMSISTFYLIISGLPNSQRHFLNAAQHKLTFSYGTKCSVRPQVGLTQDGWTHHGCTCDDGPTLKSDNKSSSLPCLQSPRVSHTAINQFPGFFRIGFITPKPQVAHTQVLHRNWKVDEVLFEKYYLSSSERQVLQRGLYQVYSHVQKHYPVV